MQVIDFYVNYFLALDFGFMLSINHLVFLGERKAWMPRQKKPLSVKEKDGEITIKFNAEGWRLRNSTFLEFLARYVSDANDLSDGNIHPSIGKFLADAIDQHALNYFPPEGGIQEVMARHARREANQMKLNDDEPTQEP